MSDIYLSLTETPAVVTLSQPVISGALSSTVTVANTVTVALDANSLSALENVTVTVGAAVSVSNFPASQVVSVSNFPASSSVTIGGFSTSSLPPSTVTVGNTVTIAGTVTANVSGDWGVVVTSGVVGGTSNSGVIDLTGYPQNSLIEATLQISGGSPVRKFQEIDSQGQYPGADITLTKTFDGSTVVNFDPANSPSGVYVFRNPGGYVRFAYVSAGQGTNTQSYKIRAVRDPYYGLNRPISGTVTVGNSVTIGSIPAISGTVTVNSLTDALLNSASAFGIAGDNNGTIPFYGVQLGFGNTNGDFETATQTNPFPIRGTVTIGSLPAISGTVTAAAPNGSLTTRFGTPTTANVSFATSAVTNANRKYLLIQNVTTGSNVITVGIGFTPTTTQGIQLTAGAGITFESSYIPTGAVYVLSSVTASNFTILEA